MIIRSFLEKIQDILLAQLLAFSLVFALTSSLCLTYPIGKMLLIIIACIIVLFLMLYNKKTTLASCLLVGSTIIATIIYALLGKVTKAFLLFFEDYFLWLDEFIMYADSINPTYELITMLALCALISIFAYIFIVKKFIFTIVLTAGAILFAVQWSYGIVSSFVPFYMFLVAVLLAYFKHVYHLKTAAGPNEYAKPFSLAIWSLPVCILVIALASSIQASDKPIEWNWLDQKLFSVYNYFKGNLDYEVFDYFSLSASSGFGDRSNILGGRVTLDSTNVLDVNTANRVYLKGISRDFYTGNRWMNSMEELAEVGYDYSSLYSGYDEMIEGMKILTEDDQFLENYFTVNPVTVSFINIKTKSLFIPSNVNVFKHEAGSILGFVSNTGDYSADKRLSKGFKYTMNTFTPRIGSEEFTQVIQRSKRGLYAEAIDKLESLLHESIVNMSQTNDLGSDNIKFDTDLDSGPASDVDTTAGAYAVIGADTGADAGAEAGAEAEADTGIDVNELSRSINSLTALKMKSDLIYEMYLQLPEELPQRVINLSSSLVEFAENDYAKAKAIEQYLASNYPYNLDVRSTPRDRDFVDYFLFDLKEGYCSYYASAMAILARSAGLPARYVEGYMLPPESVKGSPNTYIVTNMQAHAWVEIYFEGYGWLPFEPTSPFRSSFYSTRSSDVSYGTGYDSSYLDYMEMMERYANQDFGQFDYYAHKSEAPPTTTIILIAIGSLAILLVSLIFFNKISSRYKLYKLTNLSVKDCILCFYNYYEKVLAYQGLGLKPSETPSEYSDRVDSRMYFGSVRFRSITDIFVKYRYGPDVAVEDNKVGEKEKKLVCDFYTDFTKAIKGDMGKFKYGVYRYLLNKL